MLGRGGLVGCKVHGYDGIGMIGFDYPEGGMPRPPCSVAIGECRGTGVVYVGDIPLLCRARMLAGQKLRMFGCVGAVVREEQDVVGFANSVVDCDYIQFRG